MIKRGIKIHHNWKLLLIIILLIILSITLFYFGYKNEKGYYLLNNDGCVKIYVSDKELNNYDKVYTNLDDCEKEINTCSVDSDCVPDSCCHAQSCVSLDKKPVCDKVFCSQVCSGPLDCNQGSCECIKGKCGVKTNE
ncbi:MAG: hypothetical protein WC438_00480 [Candidatus Pacearchaeota archaeon]